MTQNQNESTSLTTDTVDNILSGITQTIAGVLGALLGMSPFATARLGKYLYDNKGLIFSLIVSPILIIALLMMSGNKASSIDKGKFDTEETNIEGVSAVVLKVPYFNQWLEPNGSLSPTQPKIPIDGENWDLGNVICGAASSVMVAGYYGKLQFKSNDEHDLKRYTYLDEGLSLPSKCTDSSIGGAFGMTAYDSKCNQSSFSGISSYLDKIGLEGNSIGAISFEKVKNSIDKGRPLIVSIIAPYGHISVIKGYTLDGRLVMNDPFRNIQDLSSSAYSYKGKNAIYKVDTGWTVNFIMEVLEK